MARNGMLDPAWKATMPSMPRSEKNTAEKKGGKHRS
jgi:hypothetical protein